MADDNDSIANANMSVAVDISLVITNSNTADNVESSEKSFHAFHKLPREVRDMIWKLASGGKRIIELHRGKSYHPAGLPQNPNMKLCHALLHTYHESRELFLTIFTSLLGIPKSSYEYIGQTNFKEMQRVLRQMKCYKYGGPKLVATMSEIIRGYLHSDPNKASMLKDKDQVVKQGRPFPELKDTLWFDVKEDILMIAIKETKNSYHLHLSFNVLKMLSMAHCGAHTIRAATRLQHVAFKIEEPRSVTCHNIYNLGTYSPWTNFRKSHNDFDWSILSSLESISILIGDSFEVLTFTSDDKDILKVGQWSFSLDTNSTEFKAEIGAKWANVTWRIKLGKDRNLSLMNRFLPWTCDGKLWRHLQGKICEGNEKVGAQWNCWTYGKQLITPNPQLQLIHPTLVDVTVPGTYLGPSKA